MLATLGLVYLFAALAQAASPPSFNVVTCSSIRTPQSTIIVDRIARIFLKTGSTSFSAQEFALLDGYVEHYDALPRCHVFIAGHADRVGPAAANLELSRRRAEKVSAYLRSRGLVAPITVELFGETRPLIETADGVAEPQNRRVELYVGEPPAP